MELFLSKLSPTSSNKQKKRCTFFPQQGNTNQELVVKLLNTTGGSTVVHIFSDDAEHLRHYWDTFQSARVRDPPLIAFGCCITARPEGTTGSYSSLPRPKPERRTSLADFAKDVMVMTLSHAFHGTTSSTVTDLVVAFREALRLPGHHSSSIGRMRVVHQPVAEARRQLCTMAKLVAESTFNAQARHMTPMQREFLERITSGELAELDAFFLAQNGAGEERASIIGKALYQAHPHMAEKCKAYNSKFGLEIAGKGALHWMKAVIIHRLNPYLIARRAAHNWEHTGTAIRKVLPLDEAAYGAALGGIPLDSLAEDTAAYRMLAEAQGGEATAQLPPWKKARLGDVAVGNTHRSAGSAASSSEAARPAASSSSTPVALRMATSKARPSTR